MFLESCPFLLGCQICWHIIAYSILLFFFFFVFLWYQLIFLLFRFVYLGSLSVLLGEPGQRFVNFVYIFKEPALGFVNLVIIFLISVLFISSLIFSISFLRLTLGFFFLLLLFKFFQAIGQVVYLRFFLFFDEGLYRCELPFKNYFGCIPQILYCCLFIVICLNVFFLKFLI